MRLLRYTQLLEQLVGDLNQAPTTAENTLRAPVTSVTGALFALCVTSQNTYAKPQRGNPEVRYVALVRGLRGSRQIPRTEGKPERDARVTCAWCAMIIARH